MVAVRNIFSFYEEHNEWGAGARCVKRGVDVAYDYINILRKNTEILCKYCAEVFENKFMCRAVVI